MPDSSLPRQSNSRSATFDFWQEPNGYWSAKVTIRIPWRPNWVQEFGEFHNADEALEWCRQQMLFAVRAASA